LDFDVLFIREQTQVVIELKSVWLVATLANRWLNDLALFDESALLAAAKLTRECSFLHFGNDVAAPNDNALEGNELLNVRGV